jgi:hypothetical protein
MSRGTYLTHRLGFNRPALSLADVSRLSQLDHIEKLLLSVLIVDRERIRGLALTQCYGAQPKTAKTIIVCHHSTTRFDRLAGL